jgi:long-chain acyl-CoA synthetase
MNLAAVLGKGARGLSELSSGRHTAIVDDAGGPDSSITYERLFERAALVRGGLAAEGIAKGDRVGLALGNRAEFVVAYLAALGLGAPVVPINPDSPEPELSRLLERSKVKTLLRDASALPVGEPLEVTEVDPTFPAVLCDTAGTSGPSRSAVLTHGNLTAALEQVTADPRMALQQTDVVLGVLPLFHIYGLQVVLGSALTAGAEVRLRSRFDPSDSLGGVTVVSGVPAMFDAWARSGPDVASARLIVSGAAPLLQATEELFRSATGRSIVQGYGLTEASPVVTSGLLLDEPDPMSVGLALSGVEVRLVGRDGHPDAEVMQGDPGEILVRGPNVFTGYDGEPEVSARVLRGGWLHTGDIGIADEGGRLYIVDRSKDIIIVSGFNVYPGEVEDVLVSHPSVSQAAVVGVADERTGEAVRAFVVPAGGGGVDEAALIEWCRTHLSRYKCPHRIEVRSELPALPTGKVLRRSLSGQ